MVRAAAKNHAWVGDRHEPRRSTTACSRSCTANDGALAGGHAARARARGVRAHRRVRRRDRALAPGAARSCREHLVLALDRTDEQLRYGENPHQQAARYRLHGTTSWWDGVNQHSGLALSYLNLYDADAAWQLVHDLVIAGADVPACAIIKHANPCGVAVAGDLATAYQRALECDERSAFGGIVAVNRPLDAATVERMVAGPAGRRRDRAVLRAGHARRADREAQEHAPARRAAARADRARLPPDQRRLPRAAAAPLRRRAATTGASSRSGRPPTSEWRDAELAWRVCGHVKSNAIVLVKDGQAVGIGAGQQNRVEAGEIAAKKADGRARGGACASDAFYPFPDGIEAAAGGRCRGDRAAGRSHARRAEHRARRRARRRDGVHGRTALPPLTALMRTPARDVEGAADERGHDARRPGRGRGVRRSRPARREARRAGPHARARHHPRGRRRRERALRRDEDGQGRGDGHGRRPTSTCPRTRPRPTSSPRSVPSTTTRPSTRCSCSTRRRRRSTTRPRSSRWTPTRTSTGCTR